MKLLQNRKTTILCITHHSLGQLLNKEKIKKIFKTDQIFSKPFYTLNLFIKLFFVSEGVIKLICINFDIQFIPKMIIKLIAKRGSWWLFSVFNKSFVNFFVKKTKNQIFWTKFVQSDDAPYCMRIQSFVFIIP